MKGFIGIAPRRNARVAGLFYLLTTIAGMTALFIGGKLFVAGDTVTTATNVLSHPVLVWAGPAINILASAFYAVVTLLLYRILKPVNRELASIAASLSLIGCTIGAASEAFDIAPGVILNDARNLAAFTPEQLHTLAYESFKLNGVAYDIAMIFFGFYCVLTGYLVFRSTFLPKLLGILMAIAGLGWLTFLVPPVNHLVSPYIGISGIMGEGLLALWLLIFGLNEHKWRSQVATQKVNDGILE